MFKRQANVLGVGFLCLVSLAGGPASANAAPAGRTTEWRLDVDLSVIADSNVTNSTNDDTISIFYDGIALPAPLDPSLRAHADIGLGGKVGGAVDVPLGERAALALDAEIFALDQQGRANDDVGVLIAAGPELAWPGGEAGVQLIAFERWYGGVSATSGWGVRGRYSGEVEPGGARISLLVDARVFESDYGDPFGGAQGAAYLSYQDVIGEGLTGSGGVYARREWLEDDAYSSLEIGAYGGLSRFLGPDLTGSLSAGLSHVRFDAPVLFLSADRRGDWRFYSSLSLTTRKPIGWGLFPSLTYTYGRTRSSTGFFDADRHRLRAGLAKTF